MIDTVALKQKIIDMATSGALSSHDENDESIEVLLSRLPEPSNKRKRLLTLEFDYDDLFEIPDHWKWINLGLISSYGDTPTKVMPNESNADTWILELEDIESGGRLIEKKRVSDKDAIGEKTAFKRNQVLYSKLRPYLKKVLVADEDGISTPELISSEIFGGILPQFIVLCLTNSYVDKVINKRSYGVKMPRVDAGFMVNLPIPIPPVQEQQRIVYLVHSAFEQILTISELQSAYASDLEVLKSKIIDAGIHGKLTEQLPEDGNAEDLYAAIQDEKNKLIKEKKIKKSKALLEIAEDEIPFKIPDNWKWVKLDGLCTKISSGSTPKGGRKGNVYVPEGYSFFREQNIYNDGIHREGLVFITEELLNTRHNSTVFPKDILLNITGGSIGRCALIPDDFTKGSINQHILIIRLVNPEMRGYIHQYLCSPFAQRYIKGNAVGDKDGFSGGRCKNMPVPMPPLSEQKRITEKINDMLNAMDNIL